MTSDRRPGTTAVRLRLFRWAIGIIVSTARRLLPVPRRPAPAGERPTHERILIVRLDELGDMVLFSGFFRELRRCRPDAHITLVASRIGATVMAASPHLDRLVVFDERMRGPLRPILMPFVARRFAKEFLTESYDLAIQPRWDLDSHYAAWLIYFSGAATRVGYSTAVTRRKAVLNHGLDALYTTVIDDPTIRHESDRGAHLLRELGCDDARTDVTEIWTSSSDARPWLDELLAATDSRPVIALSPSGGHSPLKAWAVERFAAVARELIQTEGATVVLLGAPSERELANEFIRHAPGGIVDLVGKTKLPDIAEVLDRAALYLGNDTGLLHMAVARGIRTVSIYGSSPPTHFGPRGAKHDVLWKQLPCGPPFDAVAAPPHARQLGLPAERCVRCIYDAPKCMDEVGVDEVSAACRNALSEWRRSRAKNPT
jgi:ADP-heptose:LPS heptosyltransferase